MALLIAYYYYYYYYYFFPRKIGIRNFQTVVVVVVVVGVVVVVAAFAVAVVGAVRDGLKTFGGGSMEDLPHGIGEVDRR